ncbi:helix-turn-helix domain-containing protein [Haloarculaceae archaeon H-GB2-1]|nr:helix-turn-helix domain-containing protein [Haloarculaceae archaeon H-GB1-1]MEA5387646.1 helix-turn-helix domain-containing protein [Haloarculaceae archaeon H-GB11]MEA5409133.1 helix-turn-helix domain-containing protein [Haloarculaceae archaeon H-GB2-1]
MVEDSRDHARVTAIEQLRALGLSTYAARTFVALVSLGEGTAQDVSHVADVPRTRVYDAADELSARGLLDVRKGSPKRFWPVSSETAERTFRQEYSQRVDELVDALEMFEPDSTFEEQRGVWTVTGRPAVENRAIEFIEEATESVTYMTTSGLLGSRELDALRDAADRTVDIRLAGASDAVETNILGEVPNATTFESIWDGTKTPAGRLLLVDETRAMVSVLVEDGDCGREETAIWGVGETNSLLVVVRAMFTWQFDD